MKTCPRCGKYKPLSEFHKNKSRKDGVNGWCKLCMSEKLKARYQEKHDHILEQARLYRINNPEKRKLICKNYRQSHREERRKNEYRLYHTNPKKYLLRKLVVRHRKRVSENDGFTATEWEALCKKSDYRCVACKQKKPLTVDHVIPISQGGSNQIENIQPLCVVCNSKKYNKTIDYRPSFFAEVRNA
jgi:5-methylcytosine-specific restriction endonuclease McrA